MNEFAWVPSALRKTFNKLNIGIEIDWFKPPPPPPCMKKSMFLIRLK